MVTRSNNLNSQLKLPNVGVENKLLFGQLIKINNGLKKINAFLQLSAPVLPVLLAAVLLVVVELFVVCLLLAEWHSKFWTISAHCASGGEETSRESHPSASASIPICTDPRVWALRRRRRRWRNFLWKQCSGSSLQMYCVVVHYKTAAAAAVEEHQPVLDQKQTQLPKTTCKLEAALRQPLGRLNRRPPAEKLLSTSSSFTTYIKLWTKFGCKKRQGFPSRRGRV